VKITEVRIYPKEEGDKKLRAFATLTFDECFVVRDIKIIEGTKGLFVAMPSRRMKGPCPECGHRNVVRSRYCNQCGTSQPAGIQEGDGAPDPSVRQTEHKDVAHPITAGCREYIQRTVLEAYQKELSGVRTVGEEQQQS